MYENIPLLEKIKVIKILQLDSKFVDKIVYFTSIGPK